VEVVVVMRLVVLLVLTLEVEEQGATVLQSMENLQVVVNPTNLP